MHVIHLSESTPAQQEQAALLLAHAFVNTPSAIDITTARQELQLTLGTARRGLLALDETDVLGFIGAIVHTVHMWELHPLVVCENNRGRGIGRALVQHLEAEARLEGACMIWLGTDDDFGGTNLYGKDLYPNVLQHLLKLAPTKGHPYQFYQQLGYSVVGVLPDASGRGAHDILMAKRLHP